MVRKMLLYKNAYLKIRHSLGRFLSLFLIIAIGVGFYAGIKEAIPQIRHVQNTYNKKYHLMDFKIVSTQGLTQKDIQALTSKDVKEIEGSYNVEALEKDHAIMIHAITTHINTSRLIKGRMPQKKEECLADVKHYKLHQVLTITKDQKQLKVHRFKVVGLITNPLYATTNYGTAPLGNGQRFSYLYIPKESFDVPVYQLIYLTFKRSYEDAYAKSYKTLIKEKTNTLQIIARQAETRRTQDLKNEAYQKLKPKEKKLTKKKSEGLQALQNQENKIKKAQSQLQKAQVTFNTQKVQAQKQMTHARIKLQKQISQLKEAEKKCQQALATMQRAKSQQANTAAIPVKQAAFSKQQATLEKQLKTIQTNKQKCYTAMQKLKEQETQSQKQFAAWQMRLHTQAQQLTNAQEQLNTQKQKFIKEIKNAESKIKKAKKKIALLKKAKWYITTRNDEVTSYKDLEGQYDEVTAIANIIPVFFIIIVMMMTSNTMTRMISEERSEMGTFASLGFSDRQIVSTYLCYVLVATLSGVCLGYFIGIATLPRFVYNCFPLTYPALTPLLNLPLLLIILTVAIVLMVGVTLLSCDRELREAPAYLLREKAPSKGAHVIFERIPWIWRHCSFSWKVTLRNLSRYKKRTIMTIFGTLGCAMLILLGFGIRDGISSIGERQYKECVHYDEMIILNHTVTKETKALRKLFDGSLNKRLYAYSSANTYSYGDHEGTFYTMAFSKTNDLFTFKDIHSSKNLSLTDDGAIITQKMAELLKVKIGNKVSFKDSEGKRYTIRVSGICHNYVSNYAYMTKAYYQKVYHKPIQFNTVFAKSQVSQQKITKHLLDSDHVLTIQYTANLIDQANKSISGLDEIVVMLVIISSLLALSVLYNLTSINMSERTREIATLKVLGFKPSETNAYIDRETIIAMIIGILFGLLVTTLIFGTLMQFVETSDTIFIKTMKPISYLYTIGITLSFAFIMAIITSYKVNRIDMIESLKSIE